MSDIRALNAQLQADAKAAKTVKAWAQAATDLLAPAPPPPPPPPPPTGIIPGFAVGGYADLLHTLVHLNEYEAVIGDLDELPLMADKSKVPGIGFVYQNLSQSQGSDRIPDLGNPAASLKRLLSLLNGAQRCGVMFDNDNAADGPLVPAYMRVVGPGLLEAGYHVLPNLSGYLPGSKNGDVANQIAWVAAHKGWCDYGMMEYAYETPFGPGPYTLRSGADLASWLTVADASHENGMHYAALTYGTLAQRQAAQGYTRSKYVAGDLHFIGVKDADNPDPYDASLAAAL